jgi:hypothetical protein
MLGTVSARCGRNRHGKRRLSGRAFWMSSIALGSFGLGDALSSSARAVDFEIQEATVEKGEIELEYRGSVFEGQPKQAIVDEEEEEDEEEAPLDHSHDVELQLGLTERIMLSATGVMDKPVDEDFRLSVAEVEAQYELFQETHSALSLQFEYEFATIGNTPDEFSFGPLMEYWLGPYQTTANLFLTGQAGDNVETDGPGFEYALQFKRALTGRFGVGAEAFGEIEDLSNAGSFDDQEHYVGPMLYLGKAQNEVSESGDDEEDGDEPEKASLSFSTGVIFGLTDVTSDVVYRLNAFLEF